MPPRKRYYPARHAKKDHCMAAGMPLDQSTRDHCFLTRCTDCPEWWELHDKHPLAAHRSACKHARNQPGHRAYVINVTQLTVVRRYQFDALEAPSGSNTEPPF